MYEEVTYEEILERMLERVPDDMDKREGSLIYDALAPAAIELQIMSIIFLGQYFPFASKCRITRSAGIPVTCMRCFTSSIAFWRAFV